jgi:hypothetical protein
MNGIAFLIAIAASGVDYGWQPAKDGQLEYIIQIEPVTVYALGEGQDIVSQIDPYVRFVRRFRLRVGNALVPRVGTPPRDPPPIPDEQPPEGVSFGWKALEGNTAEFVIQLSPERLQRLRSGEEVSGVIPATQTLLTQIRIVSTGGQPPAQPAAAAPTAYNQPVGPSDGGPAATAPTGAAAGGAPPIVRSVYGANPPGNSAGTAGGQAEATPTGTAAGNPAATAPGNSSMTGNPNAAPAASPGIPAASGGGPAAYFGSGNYGPAQANATTAAADTPPNGNRQQPFAGQLPAPPTAPSGQSATMGPADFRQSSSTPWPQAPELPRQDPTLSEPPRQDTLGWAAPLGSTANPASSPQAPPNAPAGYAGAPSYAAPSYAAPGYRPAVPDSAETAGAGYLPTANSIYPDDNSSTASVPTLSPHHGAASPAFQPRAVPASRTEFSQASLARSAVGYDGANAVLSPQNALDRHLAGDGIQLPPFSGIGPAKSGPLDFWQSLAQTANDPSLSYLREDDTDRPWWPLSMAMLGLFASIGANLYIGWIAVGIYRRYLDVAAYDELDERDERDADEDWDDREDRRRAERGRRERATADAY